ncbi:MAG: nucleotide exchange factor GrpE [Chloroflexota bacterium]|nr:nucleotide exchange factor GrpE [Chloroflexota bacterium]
MSAEETTNVAAEAAQPEGAPVAGDIEAQLEATRKQAQEYLEGWQRARAEFANYKRRTERELQENRDMAMGIAFKGVVPIVDDFDRALASIPSELQGNPWVNGVSMVQRKLVKLMEDNGVTQFDPVGEMFDPTRHEAIGTDDEGDAPSGQVTMTMQRGYLIGDKVLRPALVKVKS